LISTFINRKKNHETTMPYVFLSPRGPFFANGYRPKDIGAAFARRGPRQWLFQDSLLPDAQPGDDLRGSPEIPAIPDSVMFMALGFTPGI
jgi:hypothetical protein